MRRDRTIELELDADVETTWTVTPEVRATMSSPGYPAECEQEHEVGTINIGGKRVPPEIAGPLAAWLLKSGLVQDEDPPDEGEEDDPRDEYDPCDRYDAEYDS